MDKAVESFRTLSEHAQPFATLSGGQVVACDGGTFHGGVALSLPPGPLQIHMLPSGDALALSEGARPIRWENAGFVIIDSGVCAYLGGEAHAELLAMDGDEGDDFTDVIDEALFGEDAAQALVHTPGGRALVLFRMMGDGEYDVAAGYDAAGALCAVLVLGEWDG